MRLTPELLRNLLATPILMSALRLLQPCQAPRAIERLIRTGRIADAAALAEMLIAEADRP
jgi:hypothetical protein